MLDFNSAMRGLVAEIIRVVPEFRSIQLNKVWISATFNHSRKRSGLLAYVLPLRYRHGRPVEVRMRGNRVYHFAMSPVRDQAGQEILYILYFMLPRFYHLSLRDKLETVVHELFHIGPSFNGDLRRFRGRSELHGDHKTYDQRVKGLTDLFLTSPHDSETYRFLRHGYEKAEREYGGIDAHHIPEPRPKLLKVATTIGVLSPEGVLQLK